MSIATHHSEAQEANFSRLAPVAGLVALIGAVLLIVGYATNAPMTMGSYIFAFIFWATIVLGCFGFSLLHHMLRGSWGVSILRLLEAGGGPANFSIATALTSMVGANLVKAEVAKLTRQYGEQKVKTWLSIFDFAVKDALRIATEAGVKLPKGNLKGKKLAETLVTAGLDKDNTFYVEFMLDKALSHDIHEKVMDNIDKKYSVEDDSTYHQITNQAMYDLAQALGAKKVKLASFH